MDNGAIIFGVFAIVVIPIVIWLNILTAHSIIRRALRKNILPTLTANGLTFEKYKWLGFFSSGDFDELTITFVTVRGNPFISLYADVYYDDNGVSKKGTVKIKTFMLFIRKVVYSPKFRFAEQ